MTEQPQDRHVFPWHKSNPDLNGPGSSVDPQMTDTAGNPHDAERQPLPQGQEATAGPGDTGREDNTQAERPVETQGPEVPASENHDGQSVEAKAEGEPDSAFLPFEHETRGRRPFSSKAKLKPDQAALVKLRESLHYSQPEMAARLGLKLTTLQSYEYGKTKKVPQKVREKMKYLEADSTYAYVVAMYAGKSMREIALGWARRMGIEPGSPTALANALHVDKSNASRWLDESYHIKLRISELAIYERRVTREEAYYQASRKRHAEPHERNMEPPKNGRRHSERPRTAKVLKFRKKPR